MQVVLQVRGVSGFVAQGVAIRQAPESVVYSAVPAAHFVPAIIFSEALL